MKKLIAISLAALALGGCRSVTVKNYGQEVVDVNGTQTVISKGWYVSHWQHWMITKADAIETSIKPGDIEFKLNGLDEKPDGDGLAKVVEKSLAGAAELTAKITAAIASCGGTTSVDAVAGLVKQFVAKGGDLAKATVTCADGSCSVTDGAVTAECTDCYAQ